MTVADPLAVPELLEPFADAEGAADVLAAGAVAADRRGGVTKEPSMIVS